MFDTLTLTNFRNHEFGRINSAGFKNIVITGPNGSGKTAILEAISMLSNNGGLRGAAGAEIARIQGDSSFAVNAELENETNLSVSYSAPDAGRKLRVDGDASPIAAASKFLRLVWLTPKEDRLFAESASDRRAFLDRMAAGFDPVHSGRVARLAKLLSERAFALKSGADATWLNAIESQLAATAASVAAARVAYAAQLNHFLQAETNARIVLSGWFESRLAGGANCVDAEKEYATYLAANRTIIADKMVIDGAHKSDFSMFRSDIDMNAGMMSAGQQKKLLLLLIIANAKLLYARTSTPVVILLDEAVAHLDGDNIRDLFARLDASPAQIWMTGANSDSFNGVNNALIVSCMDGRIDCRIKS
ncbi:MAG: AAA family ATPase [Alphaproteobacteria bacterium]|nr:AAA family ATPase [Alphaproteobacteria bacterium]